MAQIRFPRILNNKVAAGLATLVFLAGCSSPKPAAVSAPPLSGGHPDRAPKDQTIVDYVAKVRGSTMSGYPTATIGEAFEAAFRDSQWHSRETGDGVRVVSFTGTLPANMRQDCLAAKEARPARPCAQDAKVTFQWTFASDGRLFHLSYIDPEPWPAGFRSTREMLLFIYGS